MVIYFFTKNQQKPELCRRKVKMSPPNKVEMSPSLELGLKNPNPKPKRREDDKFGGSDHAKKRSRQISLPGEA